MSSALGSFARFLGTVTGEVDHLSILRNREHSFFVSLTLPDLRPSANILKDITSGSDAVELRVDLLKDPSKDMEIPSVDYVAEQISLLRSCVSVPLVFTIRTKSQGGKFPDDAFDSALELYRLAVRMGSEFVDLEISFPDDILRAVTQMKGFSKIIASHHDVKGQLSWANGSWIQYYNKALQYGDVIKLVGVAGSIDDNTALKRFKAWAEQSHNVPVIAINMGDKGRLSRMLNNFMTPVSHPKLPFKAAPGQLSAKDIRRGLSLMGEITTKKFALFGKPISASRSPAMHNTLFAQNGLPHVYQLLETDNAEDVKDFIRAPNFGGASVTIPLKLDIMPLLDTVVPEAKIIGAVNTIVPVPRDANDKNKSPELVGHNTDWQGMVRCLKYAGAFAAQGQATTSSGLVIGSGGTARAAIYSLYSMGYSPIYLVGRTPSKSKALASSFNEEYNIRVLESIEDLKSIPHAAIGTIPGDQPIEPVLREILCQIFKTDHGGDTQIAATEPTKRILLEMAYKPTVTPLTQLASGFGWTTIPGLEVLVAQGVHQVSLPRKIINSRIS